MEKVGGAQYRLEFQSRGGVQAAFLCKLLVLSLLCLGACAGATAGPPLYPSPPAQGPPGAPDQPYVYGVQNPHALQATSPAMWRELESDPLSSTVHHRYGGSSAEYSFAGQPRHQGQRETNSRVAVQAIGPARKVLLTAMRMIDDGYIVKGSCYDYIDAIFKKAGHDGWRKREKVYRKPKKGPYVNLDLVKPGDWLWVISSPRGERIRTHSVLFLGWENRRRGLAQVVSHPGQSRAVSGEYRIYDVSRTYNITRASTQKPKRRARRKK